MILIPFWFESLNVKTGSSIRNRLVLLSEQEASSTARADLGLLAGVVLCSSFSPPPGCLFCVRRQWTPTSQGYPETKGENACETLITLLMRSECSFSRLISFASSATQLFILSLYMGFGKAICSNGVDPSQAPHIALSHHWQCTVRCSTSTVHSKAITLIKWV